MVKETMPFSSIIKNVGVCFLKTAIGCIWAYIPKKHKLSTTHLPDVFSFVILIIVNPSRKI